MAKKKKLHKLKTVQITGQILVGLRWIDETSVEFTFGNGTRLRLTAEVLDLDTPEMAAQIVTTEEVKTVQEKLIDVFLE